MTTEVYRNMLLEQEPMVFGGGPGRVGVVILDEFHYMNDRSRVSLFASRYTPTYLYIYVHSILYIAYTFKRARPCGCGG